MERAILTATGPSSQLVVEPLPGPGKLPPPPPLPAVRMAALAVATVFSLQGAILFPRGLRPSHVWPMHKTTICGVGCRWRYRLRQAGGWGNACVGAALLWGLAGRAVVIREGSGDQGVGESGKGTKVLRWALGHQQPCSAWTQSAWTHGIVAQAASGIDAGLRCRVVIEAVLAEAAVRSVVLAVVAVGLALQAGRRDGVAETGAGSEMSGHAGSCQWEAHMHAACNAASSPSAHRNTEAQEQLSHPASP